MTASQWRERGELRRVGKHHLFCVDTGSDDAGDRPTLLILHGYPTSSYDYARVLPILAARFRVIVHDHLGFGLSDKPIDYSYSLFEQADHAIALWQSLGVTHGFVLAHDYGTSVATELVARRNLGYEPITIDSLTLCNGSMHIEMARLRPIQRMLRSQITGPLVARLASRRVFHRNLRHVVADPTVFTDDELDVMWQHLIGSGGRAVLPRVTRYLDERRRFWHRWIGALRETDLDVNILWARKDPVAVEAMAQVLHDEIAGSRLVLLDDLGHFPMIEDPDAWGRAVIDLIGS